MYNGFREPSRFYELKSLIHEYMDYGDKYKGPSLEEISNRAYQYYEEDRLSDSQYDHICQLLEDLE